MGQGWGGGRTGEDSEMKAKWEVSKGGEGRKVCLHVCVNRT